MGPIAYAVYTKTLQEAVYPVYADLPWTQWLPLRLRDAFRRCAERHLRSVK